MIKINLATRKQAAAVDMKASGKSGGLNGLFGGAGRPDLDGIKDLPIRKLALMVAVGFAASYVVDDYKAEELKKVENVLSKAMAERTKAQTELAKTKDFDAIKKQLEADEFILRTKIETIEKLVVDRQTPPKLLIALAGAIPEEVWLSNFKIEDSNVSLTGTSLGYSQISDFMKNLNENAYFTDLRLEKTEQTKDERGGGLATFELLAKRR